MHLVVYMFTPLFSAQVEVNSRNKRTDKSFYKNTFFNEYMEIRRK